MKQPNIVEATQQCKSEMLRMALSSDTALVSWLLPKKQKSECAHQHSLLSQAKLWNLQHKTVSLARLSLIKVKSKFAQDESKSE